MALGTKLSELLLEMRKSPELVAHFHSGC